MHISPVNTLPKRLATRGREVWLGALYCALIAAVATMIGHIVPLVGSAIPAVVLGVVVSLIRTPSAKLRPGIGYSSKFVLQCAVVLLGAQLSLRAVIEVGAESLPVMLTSLTVCLFAAWWLGRILKIDRDVRTLIGVGTGICGASAIAAISPVIRAKSADISYAISTVFLFNIVAVLVFPAVGHALGMTPHAFGLFAGTAVNDTSSVVAAASAFSTAALGFAVVVKLVRTLMIIPISIGLAVIDNKRSAEAHTFTLKRIFGLVPWFLIGFLVVAAVTSTGIISPRITELATQSSVFLVAMALAGIGLSTDLAAIRKAGFKPLLLGGILSLLVALTTIGTMFATGHLAL